MLHRKRSDPASRERARSGTRMSGLLNWASTEPSSNSTSECTMLCGWMTTLTRSGPIREQVAGLDQFEALVHQRRGIDRDLAAHAPVGMGDGLLGRHRCKVFVRRVQERAARGGQHDRVLRQAAARRQYWPGGRHWKTALCSLSIGRIRAPERPRRIDQQRACQDQRLLVGKQQLLAGSRRRKGRCETGRTDDCRHHELRLRQRCDRDQGLGTGQHARAAGAAAETRREPRCGGAIEQRRVAGPETQALRERGASSLARAASANHTESVRDAAPPRRACSRRSNRSSPGRPAPSCHAAPARRNRAPAAARTTVRLSIRSSTPP